MEVQEAVVVEEEEASQALDIKEGGQEEEVDSVGMVDIVVTVDLVGRVVVVMVVDRRSPQYVHILQGLMDARKGISAICITRDLKVVPHHTKLSTHRINNINLGSANLETIAKRIPASTLIQGIINHKTPQVG